MTTLNEHRPADAHRRLAATALTLGSEVVWLVWAICALLLGAMVLTIIGAIVSAVF